MDLLKEGNTITVICGLRKNYEKRQPKIRRKEFGRLLINKFFHLCPLSIWMQDKVIKDMKLCNQSKYSERAESLVLIWPQTYDKRITVETMQ